MNKNKFYVYALLYLSLISYPCIASGSEKEEAAQALINLSNPSPQSEQQPYILPQHSGHEEEEEAQALISVRNHSPQPEQQPPILLSPHLSGGHDQIESWIDEYIKNFQLDKEAIFDVDTPNDHFFALQIPEIPTDEPQIFNSLEEEEEETNSFKSYKIKSLKCQFKTCECKNEFESSELLKKHIQEQHTSVKNVCEYCGLKLNYTSALEIHKRKHTGEKPFPCRTCDKSFAQLSTLKVHTKTHTNAESFAQTQIIPESISITKNYLDPEIPQPSLSSVIDTPNDHFFALQIPEIPTDEPQIFNSLEEEEEEEEEEETNSFKSYKIKSLKCQFKTCECKNEFESSELLKEHIQKQHSQFKNVCEICGKSFSGKGHLTIHKRTHTGEKPFKCTIDKCDRAFKDQGNLIKHINSIHKGHKPYRCTSCNKSFAKKQCLQRHQDSQFGCLFHLKKTHDFASKVTPSVEEYSSKSFEAPEYEFPESESFEAPEYEFPEDEFEAVDRDTSYPTTTSQQPMLPFFDSNEDSSEPSNKEDVHDNNETESEQPLAPQSNDLTQQMRTKSYECICGESFAQLRDLKGHLASESNCWLQLKRTRAICKDDSSAAKPSDQNDASEPSKKIVAIEAPESESKFTVAASDSTSAVNNGCQYQLSKNLTASKANASIVASSYQLDSSNKEDVHDSDETGGEQPLTPQSNDLTQQIRTKSYECILCGESFAQLSDLKSHFTPMSNCWLQLKRTRAAFKDDFSIAKSLDQADASEPSTKIVAIEAPESESEFTVAASGGTSAVNNEPYKIKDLFCKFKTCECKNEFESSELLKEHIQKQHSQFKNVCEICGKSFAQLGDLTRHTRTHTGEKPCPCKICGKSFAKLSDLARHTRTHTGEKPFPCGTCDKSFPYKNSLERHIRTHTSDKPFPCGTCDKSFARKDALARHTRVHTDSRENRKRKEPHQDKAGPSHQAELSSESDESEEICREEDTETEE